MNTTSTATPASSYGTDIKLLRYAPRSGSASRIIGAVWKHQGLVRWASPILQKNVSLLDPLPFITRFPEAAYDFDHFVETISWLESVCFGAKEPRDVMRACAQDPDLGLSCIRYKGPGRDGDLMSLIGGGDTAKMLDANLLKATVILTVEHLVKEHPVLKGLPLELFPQASSECARLHLQDGCVVHIYFDRDTAPDHVVTKLLIDRDSLSKLWPASDQFFFAFAQIKTALPVTLISKMTATGMKLPHIANGLVRLVWSIASTTQHTETL